MMELPGRARGRPPGCLAADLVWWSPLCFCRESLLPLEILAALVHDARRASFKAGTAASARGCGVAPRKGPEYQQRDAISARSSLHACSYLGGAGAGPRLLVFHLTYRQRCASAQFQPVQLGAQAGSNDQCFAGTSTI